MLARILTTGLAATLFLPALLRADDAPKGDKDLEEEWEVVETVENGKEPSPCIKTHIEFTFDSDALTIKEGDLSAKATVKTDASKAPRTLDLLIKDGDHKGETVKAIYEVKDGELRICHGAAGAERPAELASKEGSGLLLLTLKRVKK